MGVTIRPLVATDRAAVHEMLDASGAFTADELAAALEVFDAGLAGEYFLFGAEVDGAVCGYVCVSHTPLTRSTWHLYWICVHPAFEGRGIGRALDEHAGEFVRWQGGERLVLETSSRAAYARSRRFYERAGYRVAGRIAGFYAAADDCVIYCKALGCNALGAVDGETVKIGASSGKGRGIFAERRIAQGDLIEEAPVVVLPAEEVQHLDRTGLANYYFVWGEDEREAAVLLGRCSLCNHSYEPNARFDLVTHRQAIRFTALRDIEPGEEITTNYNGTPGDARPLWFETDSLS
jgi:ribosomal protein S18 acetylase RimI-like enzyme